MNVYDGSDDEDPEVTTVKQEPADSKEVNSDEYLQELETGKQ